MPLRHPVPVPMSREARRCAYIKGWLAGAVGAGWPTPPPSLPPTLDGEWNRGMHDARVSRAQFRVAQRAAR